VKDVKAQHNQDYRKRKQYHPVFRKQHQKQKKKHEDECKKYGYQKMNQPFMLQPLYFHVMVARQR
jgi:hypothetical protein